MSLVCLDTHILIWGIKREAAPGQENKIAMAQAFLKELEEDKDTRVMIPAPVIAELLTRVPHERHAAVNKLFESRFMVVPFDAAAASWYGRIFQDKRAGTQDIKAATPELTRRDILADFQIVAIAVAHQASCIYSYDQGLTKFADGYIEVRTMPEMVEQMDAFGQQA